MLTDREKWLFDLHGFLVLKQVVSREEVRRMVELAEEWHALLSKIQLRFNLLREQIILRRKENPNPRSLNG